MFFQFKQKYFFGFLLSLLFFISAFSMKLDQSTKVNKTVAEQTVSAFYEMILNKVQSQKEVFDIVKTDQIKLQILNLAESAVSGSLNLNLETLAKNQKFFEEFAKSLASKMINSLDSILVYAQVSDASSSSSNGLSKLSAIVKMDDCDKINLTVFLMQEINKALKPSGMVRLDKAKLKIACKKCGEVTCVCCMCVTCAGVTCLHPEIVVNFVQNFPKTSICCAGTATAYEVDKRCCGGYFLKAISEILKNIFSGVKCRCCNCCNDNDKDLNV